MVSLMAQPLKAGGDLSGKKILLTPSFAVPKFHPGGSPAYAASRGKLVQNNALPTVFRLGSKCDIT